MNEVDFRRLVKGLMGRIKGGTGKGCTAFGLTSTVGVKGMMVGPTWPMFWGVKGGKV